MNCPSTVSFVLILTALFCSHCETAALQPEMVSTESETERFIFGRYHSSCSGTTCVETYLITDGTLYVDNDDKRRKSFPLQGDWSPRSDFEYRIAEALLKNLPAELWLEEQDVLGAPGAYDQGGYYLEAQRSDGLHRYWLLDTEFEALPEYLQSYTRHIAEVLASLEP